MGLFVGLSFVSITLAFDSQFSSETNELDSKFDSLYEEDLSDFDLLGDEDFRVRWMDDYETVGLGCGQYEECAYIEVATLETCAAPVRFDFSLVDYADKVLFRDFVLGESMKSGTIQRILVGTKWKKDFDSYLPDDISCHADELTL